VLVVYLPPQLQLCRSECMIELVPCFFIQSSYCFCALKTLVYYTCKRLNYHSSANTDVLMQWNVCLLYCWRLLNHACALLWIDYLCGYVMLCGSVCTARVNSFCLFLWLLF